MKTKAKPVRVVGYCRVSTEEQAREGVSLDAQRERITQYATLYGYELVHVFVDAGLSGKSLDRPELKKALSVLENKEADGLVVAKLDRLTRRVHDLAALIEQHFTENKAHLLSVSEQLDTHSAAGRLLVHILVSVAEWERETIAERVRDALAHLKDKGVRLGSVGLGWRLGDGVDSEGRRVIKDVPHERETVDRILELRKEGYSLRGIVAVLKEERRPTKRGGEWKAQTVSAIITRCEAK